MFKTEFTPEEMDALRELLEHEINSMDIEIDRTDTHDYKMMLRHRRDLLRSAMHKLTRETAAVL
jgi:hypothetical protein